MTSTSDKHPAFSGSVAKRRLNCPASYSLEAELPDEPSSWYAQEGSAAHKLVEMRLTGALSAAGLTATVGLEMKAVIPFDEEHLEYDYLNIEVTEEMVNAVQEFEIWAKQQTEHSLLNDDYVRVETRVQTDIAEDMGGTVDLMFLEEFDYLHIVDFKYGKGVVVDAIDNEQLALYAIAAMHQFQGMYDTVKMTIYQPRAQGETVKTWEMNAEKFETKWTKKLQKAYDDCQNKPTLYRPGDWCKWCKAAESCPRAKRTVRAMVKAGPQLPSKEGRALARLLNSEVMVLEHLNKAKAAAFEILNTGGAVPGYKLVQSYGNEKWKDPDEAVKLLTPLDFANDGIIKTVPKTPKQVRKALGLTYPNKLDELTTTPYKGLIMVPETDKRPAFTCAEDFDDELSAND
jgi:hypothetical protein